ncbi:MAG: hypothetical protein K0S09_62 [Sphingobacteriaceae bacterium]|jgi:phage repressor protein C with HTH and peptisase S24 domain|nr:hypothetical protein [Sphingobacteriaceae bacterium]
MTLKDRLKAIAEHYELDVRGFEKSADLSNGYVNNAGNTLRPASLDKILEKYPEINKVWLITGEGKMLANPRLEADVISLATDPMDDNRGKKFVENADGSLSMNVPIVPVKAQAGYLLGFQDPEWFDDMEIIGVTVDKRHLGHYMAFEVKGDSMTSYDPETAERSVYEGRIVVGRDLQRHHWRSKLHIGSEFPWVIVHKKEGILIKDIIAHDVENGIITIHSLNPKYEDEKLYLDEVEQIFDVVQIVKKRKR